VGAGGAQGGQQAAVVEAETPGGQHGRLPPFAAQYRPDRVAFGQQPAVEAGQRGTAAHEPVSEALRGAADRCQRPVCEQNGAEDGERDERGDAENGGMDKPGADRRARQHGGQGKDGQRQQAADAQQ
jgi:hypothetical protein